MLQKGRGYATKGTGLCYKRDIAFEFQYKITAHLVYIVDIVEKAIFGCRLNRLYGFFEEKNRSEFE